MERSKPVQIWLGSSPVQADHLSLMAKVIMPLNGAIGLVLGEAGVGNSTGEASPLSWKLQIASSSVARVCS